MVESCGWVLCMLGRNEDFGVNRIGAFAKAFGEDNHTKQRLRQKEHSIFGEFPFP